MSMIGLVVYLAGFGAITYGTTRLVTAKMKKKSKGE